MIFDLETIRARFPALSSGVAFLDGPGGTQCPQSVIDAVAAYLRESNANLGGAFDASRRSDALVGRARATAAGFLGCEIEEVIFGANMTTLNFALTRAWARDARPGVEVLVTKLDHDANISPWLELERETEIVVRFVDIHDDGTLDLEDLEAKLSERTGVVAFPFASNALGTVNDVRRIAELAHSVGALTWVDAVHYAPHGPIDVTDLQADVLLCSPYKFFGPHLGLAYVRADLAESWRTYKVRPAHHRFETGTLPHELLAGFVAAVDYVDSIGWDAIQAHERALGQRFLAQLPDSCTLYGLPTMEDRVPTFAFNVAGVPPRTVAERLGQLDIAVWDGNYYAVEVMNRLGLGDEGAVRVGFVHYNTPAEVDRLVRALEAM
jgi:cysteine desulfurase family protein (TIGR01976 family)